MRRLCFALLAAVLSGPAAADTPAPRATALHARLVLKVVHPDETRRAALDAVKAAGGFPMLVSDTQLLLKVPPAGLGATLEMLAARGVVLEKTLDRADLTLEIAQLEAQLRSKQDIFERLRKLLDDSNVGATLQIESDMSQLVLEMEAVKGQLRVRRERAEWALVDVAFNFRQRDRLVYVSSPFEWVNSVDLSRFLGEFPE